MVFILRCNAIKIRGDRFYFERDLKDVQESINMTENSLITASRDNILISTTYSARKICLNQKLRHSW